MPKEPLDSFPYEPDPASRPIAPGLADGCYVYDQDVDGRIHALPDGPHLHVKVLGRARPANYAGDLTIVGGRIKDLTNLSGTFQFDDPLGLLAVAKMLESIGFALLPDAVRFFPVDGSRPVVLG